MQRSSIQQQKLRTRCARCREFGHWARECPEGNRGQRNDERYDRRAWRSGAKEFTSVAGHTERRPFFLGASWTFVALDPGEVLWDTGAQEGLVGKQQLNQWCKLLAEYGLQVEWSQEKPESTSGIGIAPQPIGFVYVPVGLARYKGIIRFTVVEQDVPPLLPVGIMRKLQARLTLNDNGDKVSPLCARWKVDTLPSVPTNLILVVGSSQKSRNCARKIIKDSQQITCQSSLIYTIDPEERTAMHQQETMAQQLHAVADHSRRSHRTTTKHQDLTRQTFSLHRLGSSWTNK